MEGKSLLSLQNDSGMVNLIPCLDKVYAIRQSNCFKKDCLQSIRGPESQIGLRLLSDWVAS